MVSINWRHKQTLQQGNNMQSTTQHNVSKFNGYWWTVIRDPITFDDDDTAIEQSCERKLVPHHDMYS